MATPKGKDVSDMFGNIAKKYDSANQLLSFGKDKSWRKALVKSVLKNEPDLVADLATGSGDVAFELAKIGYNQGIQPEIVGLDFCHPMLSAAKAKQKDLPAYAKDIKFAFGDCMKLPLADASVDAVTLSFGFRNFENRAKGLSEIKRILKPGGTLHILEFSQPYAFFKPLYYFYLKKILPKLAKQATGNQSAYDYLVGSIETFPSRPDLTQEIKNAGFTNIQATPLTLGTVALHTATR